MVKKSEDDSVVFGLFWSRKTKTQQNVDKKMKIRYNDVATQLHISPFTEELLWQKVFFLFSVPQMERVIV